MEKESDFFDKHASCSGKHYLLAFIRLPDYVSKYDHFIPPLLFSDYIRDRK